MEWKEQEHPRDEDGRFAYKQGGNKTKSIATEISDTETPKSKKSAIVRLGKKEYATVCSAIRTRYGNKIPTKGDLLNGNSYYEYTYDKEQELIVCTFKIQIEGNEEQIMKLRRGARYGI